MKVYILGEVYEKEFVWDLLGVYFDHGDAVEDAQRHLADSDSAEKVVDLTDPSRSVALETAFSIIILSQDVICCLH